jgi:hypothetical protein
MLELIGFKPAERFAEPDRFRALLAGRNILDAPFNQLA